MNVAIPDGDEDYIKGITGEYIKIAKKPGYYYYYYYYYLKCYFY